tara:strand:- start:218 stop:376 length:159 start_codon:yes stop_codon:yes gene_type:complete
MDTGARNDKVRYDSKAFHPLPYSGDKFLKVSKEARLVLRNLILETRESKILN